MSNALPPSESTAKTWRDWPARMRVELARLPDTLQSFSDGVADLRQVAADLTGVAAALRKVTDALDAAGLPETTEAMKRSGEALRATASRFEESQASLIKLNDALVDSMSWLPGAKDVLKPFRRGPAK